MKSNKRILVVEDEAIVAMALKETLKSLGYTVIGIATRGNDAIRIAKETWPDLILMDIRLEGSMDGIEAAEQINNYYDIPIIFLTAYSDDNTVSRAIRTKSYGYLIKPFNERELFTNIEMAIEKHELSKMSTIEEKIIDTTFSLVSDAIITTDVDGTIQRVNRAAAEMTGWSSDELIGGNLWDVLEVHSDEITEFMQTIKKKAGEEDPLVFRWPEIVEITLKSGESLSVSISADLARDERKTLDELIFVFSQ